MIYLKREVEEFQRTKTQFEAAYKALLQEIYLTFHHKGQVRDTGTPIHHRQSPQAMLGLAQGKGRRVEALLEEEVPNIDLIIEECTDIANYVLFIAALYEMVAAEC